MHNHCRRQRVKTFSSPPYLTAAPQTHSLDPLLPHVQEAELGYLPKVHCKKLRDKVRSC